VERTVVKARSTPEELLETIREMLDEPQAGDEEE